MVEPENIKTGVPIPNWGIVLGAIVVILLIYSTRH